MSPAVDPPLVFNELEGEGRAGGHGDLDPCPDSGVIGDGIHYVQVLVVVDVEDFGRNADAHAISIASITIDDDFHS
jgi:hypothetical protein